MKEIGKDSCIRSVVTTNLYYQVKKGYRVMVEVRWNIHPMSLLKGTVVNSVLEKARI